MTVLDAYPRFCTVEQAVSLAHSQGAHNVTPNSLKKAAYYGKRPLKRTKISGRVYFAKEDVMAWLESCRIDA